ncbi:MAG TPA: ROK family protein, partial [Phycisphaeraceae bacterium]
ELWMLRTKAGSRADLHARLGIRKNTVGQDVAALIEAGLIREGPQQRDTVGRPGTLLEVDPTRRHVLGLVIDPGYVACGRVNLLGQAVGDRREATVAQPQRLIPTAARFVRALVNEATLAVGLMVPGFIDATRHQVLFSASWPGLRHISLRAIAGATGGVPLYLENLTNAMATRWLMERATAPAREHLLIYLSDGAIGATLTVGGRPMPGCIVGSNELGHTRLAVTGTPRCYCGAVGCLERIFSTEYLQQLDSASPALPEAIQRHNGRAAPSPALTRLTQLLAVGIANAVNFTRCGQVTLMSDLPGSEPYLHSLIQAIQPLILDELSERVRIEPGPAGEPHSITTAAAPVLARIFLVD